MIAALVLAALPLRLSPEAPFPRVITSPRISTRVTGGVEYAEYDLSTALGPIVVHVIEIAPDHPDVHLDAVLARDALTSNAETVTSMAQRTNAIAGINGDYFDIGATNQPTNVVVKNGVILRTPRKRYALFIPRDGTARIDEVTFAGEIQIGDRTFPLDAINEMLPPHGGISLLTPEYGPVTQNDSTTLLALEPSSGTPPLGSFTVKRQVDAAGRAPAGYYAAIGPTAIEHMTLPNPGDTIVASGDLDPVSLQNLRAAVGGGPLILADGTWYDDLDGPRGGSYDMRAPQSGAALGADGTLYLIEVDGRQPDLSVGVTPHEFSALMRSFGATRGMEFDSGGSAEMAVRIPGDDAATLVNSPSDGKERPVSDGVFVYSTASVSAPAKIVAQPQIVRALPGASVPVALALVDASYHRVQASGPLRVTVQPSQLGIFRDGNFIAQKSGSGELIVRSGDLSGRVPLEISADPARVSIFPGHPAVEKQGRINLSARAFDANGYALALPASLPWRASSGAIDGSGIFSAGADDAVVSLLLGDHLANARVAVGFREVDLPFASHVHFMTSPKGGDGAVTLAGCDGCMELRYALGPAERAAYAVSDIPLPPRSSGVTFELRDDGSGARVKIVLHNALNEEVLLSGTTLERNGWRRVTVKFPQSLAQPARLTAIYVIGGAPGEARTGSIGLRNVKAVVAGSE